MLCRGCYACGTLQQKAANLAGPVGGKEGSTGEAIADATLGEEKPDQKNKDSEKEGSFTRKGEGGRTQKSANSDELTVVTLPS